MNGKEYHEYVEKECKRQWKENQEGQYGAWENQPQTVKDDYFNELYALYADLLKKSCSDCCYLGKKDEGKDATFYCNCGSSDNYENIITKENCDNIDCKDFEE